MLHPFRHHTHLRDGSRNPQEWKDMWVIEPLPDQNFLTEGLDGINIVRINCILKLPSAKLARHPLQKYANTSMRPSASGRSPYL